MRGVGDFTAGHQHRPEDESTDSQAGRRDDGQPRHASDVGSRRGARSGARDARHHGEAQDLKARCFRQSLSAALGEDAAEAAPSGAASLAMLFGQPAPQDTFHRGGNAPTTPRDAAERSRTPAEFGTSDVMVARDADRGATEAWQAILAPSGALGHGEEGRDPRDLDPAAERGLRLLAASEAAGFTGPAWSSFAPSAPAAADATSAEARVERAMAHIGRAIEAEIAAGAAGPITVTVPLEFHGSGLLRVSVTLTPDGIDVVLSRAAGVAASDAGLAEAARDLVSRLQRRAPRGAVRVLDVQHAAADGPAVEEGARRPLSP